MANLVINTHCNLQCSYCFTGDHFGVTSNQKQQMTLAHYETHLDFLQRSTIKEARLLGGEPTLHPEFPAFVKRARARGFVVSVFSNGLMPKQSMEALESLDEDNCFVLMNINHPSEMGEKVYQRQLESLRRLGQKAMPGFNIHRADFDLSFLAAAITSTGCKPAIRLGMAQPCLSGSNHYIHPKQYRFIAETIVAFMVNTPHVRLEWDCGFVRCMFSDEELAFLKSRDSEVGYHCSPILDIDPNGSAIHCYPLSSMQSLPVDATVDAATLRDQFTTTAQPYRQTGVYAECSTCALKAAGECSGGCLSTTMRRFHHTPFTVSVPDQPVFEVQS